MEALWETINNFDYSDLPIVKIVIVIMILAVTQVMRQLLASILAKQLEHLVLTTSILLDDELAQSLKPSISIVLFLVEIWAIRLILPDGLSSQRFNLALLTLLEWENLDPLRSVGRLSSVLDTYQQGMNPLAASTSNKIW